MAEVEVDEVFRLCNMLVSSTMLLGVAESPAIVVYTVSYEAAKVAANNAVPRRALSFVKLFPHLISHSAPWTLGVLRNSTKGYIGH